MVCFLRQTSHKGSFIFHKDFVPLAAICVSSVAVFENLQNIPYYIAALVGWCGPFFANGGVSNWWFLLILFFYFNNGRVMLQVMCRFAFGPVFSMLLFGHCGYIVMRLFLIILRFLV